MGAVFGSLEDTEATLLTASRNSFNQPGLCEMQRRNHFAANTSADLEQIATRIHDIWLDLEQVTFDEENGVVTIPFPDEGFKLTVYEAIKVLVKDTERIGLYDFNDFRYDSTRRILKILTGVPLTFEITVKDLRVELAEELP